VRHYAPGDVVCTQGEQEDRFALVVGGQLDIYMDQATGRTFVASLEAGRSLGGLEYLTRTPRIADAVAADAVTLLELSFADLDTVVAGCPEVMRAISAEVIGELLASQDRFIDLSAASAAPGRTSSSPSSSPAGSGGSASTCGSTSTASPPARAGRGRSATRSTAAARWSW
jgi:CRP-like cAMP-binding protein